MNTIEYPDDNELKNILDFLYDNYRTLKIFQKDNTDKIEITYVMDVKDNLTFAFAFENNDNKKTVISIFRYNKYFDNYKNMSIFYRIYIKYIYDFIINHPEELADKNQVIVKL